MTRWQPSPFEFGEDSWLLQRQAQRGARANHAMLMNTAAVTATTRSFACQAAIALPTVYCTQLASSFCRPFNRTFHSDNRVSYKCWKTAMLLMLKRYLQSVRRWPSAASPSTDPQCEISVCPSALRDSSLSLNMFQRRLKTHHFGQSRTPPGVVLTFLCDSGAGYKCHDVLTYLLT